MTTHSVSDVRSNANDQIAFVANAIGRGEHRALVFDKLHSGRSHVKTATTLAKETGLPRKRVLEEGKPLVHKQVIKQTTRDGEVAYERDTFCYTHKKKILALARSPKKLKALPTKYNQSASGVVVKISAPRALVRTKEITIDDIDSFKKIGKIKTTATKLSILEAVFKKGVQRIIGQRGTFKDWGGETSDLFSTRLKLDGKRVHAAFAFKGRGKKGLLTPAGLGKNGDQIPRLFIEDATVFLVQYGEQIASSVVQQMATYAQNKSLATGRVIQYGIIDGADSARLVAAYPSAFSKSKKK